MGSPINRRHSSHSEMLATPPPISQSVTTSSPHQRSSIEANHEKRPASNPPADPHCWITRQFMRFLTFMHLQWLSDWLFGATPQRDAEGVDGSEGGVVGEAGGEGRDDDTDLDGVVGEDLNDNGGEVEVVGGDDAEVDDNGNVPEARDEVVLDVNGAESRDGPEADVDGAVGEGEVVDGAGGEGRGDNGGEVEVVGGDDTEGEVVGEGLDDNGNVPEARDEVVLDVNGAEGRGGPEADVDGAVGEGEVVDGAGGEGRGDNGGEVEVVGEGLDDDTDVDGARDEAVVDDDGAEGRGDAENEGKKPTIEILTPPPTSIEAGPIVRRKLSEDSGTGQQRSQNTLRLGLEFRSLRPAAVEGKNGVPSPALSQTVSPAMIEPQFFPGDSLGLQKTPAQEEEIISSSSSESSGEHLNPTQLAQQALITYMHKFANWVNLEDRSISKKLRLELDILRNRINQVDSSTDLDELEFDMQQWITRVLAVRKLSNDTHSFYTSISDTRHYFDAISDLIDTLTNAILSNSSLQHPAPQAPFSFPAHALSSTSATPIQPARISPSLSSRSREIFPLPPPTDISPSSLIGRVSPASNISRFSSDSPVPPQQQPSIHRRSMSLGSSVAFPPLLSSSVHDDNTEDSPDVARTSDRGISTPLSKEEEKEELDAGETDDKTPSTPTSVSRSPTPSQLMTTALAPDTNLEEEPSSLLMDDPLSQGSSSEHLTQTQHQQNYLAQNRGSEFIQGHRAQYGCDPVLTEEQKLLEDIIPLLCKTEGSAVNTGRLAASIQEAVITPFVMPWIESRSITYTRNIPSWIHGILQNTTPQQRNNLFSHIQTVANYPRIIGGLTSLAESAMGRTLPLEAGLIGILVKFENPKKQGELNAFFDKNRTTYPILSAEKIARILFGSQYLDRQALVTTYQDKKASLKKMVKERKDILVARDALVMYEYLQTLKTQAYRIREEANEVRGSWTASKQKKTEATEKEKSALEKWRTIGQAFTDYLGNEAATRISELDKQINTASEQFQVEITRACAQQFFAGQNLTAILLPRVAIVIGLLLGVPLDQLGLSKDQMAILNA